MDESKRAGLKHAPTTLNSFFFVPAFDSHLESFSGLNVWCCVEEE
jgi:hypothetical protein